MSHLCNCEHCPLKNKKKVGRPKTLPEGEKTRKFLCPCGGKYTYANRETHKRTKKHQKFRMEREKGQKQDGSGDLSGQNNSYSD